MRLNHTAIAALGLFLPFVAQSATAAPPNEVCRPPRVLQQEISLKYPGWKVVTLADLSKDDRKFFKEDHGNACPGLVAVDFYGDGRPALALVLAKKTSTNEPTKLLVAHKIGLGWKITFLDTGGESESVPVVWSQPPSHYSDVESGKEIRTTRPVIVFAGYESWAIVYAWTRKAVTKVWIAD